MKQRYRLVAYANNGAVTGSLSHPSTYKFSTLYNDIPGLELSYSDTMPNADLLYSPCEVAVEFSVDGITWTEPPNARYLRIKRGRELVGGSRIRTFTMPGYGHLLKKAKQMQTVGLSDDGKRVMSGTVGAIMKTLIDENKAAGGSLVGMSYDFTATTDSNNQAWARTITDIAFDVGVDLYSALYYFADQGMVDWLFQGRTLRIFNPAYLDIVKPVTLRPGTDLKGLPVEADLDGMVHTALVVGDGGVKVNLNSTYSPPVYWGKWQTYITASGVTDPTTMTVLADQQFADGAGERSQLTAELQVKTTLCEPFRDFQPGNYVSAPKEVAAGADAAVADYRVRQINVDRGTDGKLKVDLVINDRFAEAEIRRARQIAALTGGAIIGGTGTTITPPLTGKRVPAVPTGLVATSVGAPNEAGYWRDVVTVNWSDVTVDVAGIALEVDQYDVQAYRGASPTPESWGRTSSSYLLRYDMDPGVLWHIRVRAVSSTGTPGAWTDPLVDLLTETDTTPPAVPSPPTLSTVLGTVTVHWDGRAAGGAPMPPDLDCVRVWQVGVTDWIGRIERGGGYVTVGSLTPDSSVSFQLSAVDHNGNESARTDTVSTTVGSAANDAMIQAELQTILSEANAYTDDTVTTGVAGNKITYSLSDPSGTGKAGDTWFKRNGTGQIIGQWEWVGTTGWVARTVESALIANLDAGKISFGEMDGLRIKAGSIRAGALAVGVGYNLIVDPYLLDPAIRTARSTGGWAYDSVNKTMTNTTQPTSRLSWAAGGPADAYTDLIPVVPGDKYLCTAVVYSSIGNTFQFQMQGYDTTGAASPVTSNTPTVAVNAGIKATIGQVFTIPSTMFFVNVGVAFTTASSGTNRVEQVNFVRQVPSVVIQDGAVTASKIFTDSVTADAIAAGAIDAMIITGATVRATSSATDNVIHDAAGIRQILGGVTTVNIRNNGSAQFTGEITASTVTGSVVRTAATGSKITLDDSGGLVSVRNDGQLNVQILKGSFDDATLHDGIVMGVNASIRFAGGVAGGYMFKDPISNSLQLRSAGSSAAGGAINFYDQGAPGTDFEGWGLSNTTHIFSGGDVAIRLLNDQTAIFTGSVLSSRMRIYSASGGTSTSTSSTGWTIQTDTPVCVFTAPRSGVVKVEVNVSMSAAVEAAICKVDVTTRQGTVSGQGTDLYSPTGILFAAGFYTQRGTGVRIVDGLTPGVNYYCRLVFSSASTETVTVGSSVIIVTPSM